MAGQLGIGAKMKKLHIPDVDPHKLYPMNRPRLGHAVIVNNIHTKMPSSDVDVEALVETYEKVGFEVQVHKDCDARKMAEIKNKMVQNETHANRNCFLMTVICHGNNKGRLLDNNKTRGWGVEELIKDLSHITSLTGRPKILILQSCRGAEWSDGKPAPSGTLADEDVTEPVILPDGCDMFVAYATVPGYRAHGGDETGSAYLQAFAAYLERHFMSEDLGTIFSMVIQYMSSRKHGKSGMLQVPEKRSTLRFQLKFSEFHQQTSQPSPTPKKDPVPALRFRMNQKVINFRIPQTETTRKWEEHERKAAKKVQQTAKKLVAQSITMATPRPVDLTLNITHDTGLQDWGATKFTVLSSGEVIMWGKSAQSHTDSVQTSKTLSTETPAALHMYCKTPRWRKQREVKGFCEHEDWVYLQPVRVNNKEQLAISCYYCQMIRLYNIGTGEVTTAFHNKRYYPSVMCRGEGDTLYVVHGVEGGVAVLELNTARVPFTGPDTTIQSGMDALHSMHYLPSSKHAIIVSDHTPGLIRAISTVTGKKIWEVKGKVDGTICHPHGLFFSPDHCALLVADGDNSRVLVLDPANGEHLQTVQFSKQMDVITEMCLYQNTLVVQHGAERKENVSYISID